MAKQPIKPVRKRRDLPPVTVIATPTPRRVVAPPPETSDPVEGRLKDSDADKAKQYVAHKMSLHAHRSDKLRCTVWIKSYVNFKRAAEWAHYWQPIIGAPIVLVIEGNKLDTVVIDHGLPTDGFPKREIDYPWKLETMEHLAQTRVIDASGQTHANKSTEPANPAPIATAVQSVPEPVAVPARRPLPEPAQKPRGTPPRRAVAVQPKPKLARRVAKPVKPAKSTPPRRVKPTPPKRRR